MSEQVPINEQTEIEGNTSVDMDHNMDTQTLIPAQQQSAEDADLVKERMEAMEKEAAKLRELHDQLSKDSESKTEEEKRDVDSRSIYVGNVDYGATPLELQQHFASAGEVQRVTIMVNKFTGQPKGFAYVEFKVIEGVEKAVATLDGSSFRDRELKVSAKRTNVPGFSTTNRGGPRGRGMRGGGRAGFRGRGRGMRGGRAGFGRGGGGGRFNPY